MLLGIWTGAVREVSRAETLDCLWSFSVADHLELLQEETETAEKRRFRKAQW